MKNNWSDKEALRFKKRYAKRGVNNDIALRVYSSRLLGNEPKLVLHGGGNTSVKTIMNDVSGQTTDVLCVKGSGWDLGDIEPEGLPAVRLKPIQKAEKLENLSDEAMVNMHRTNLLDANAPNPSVETLLHAFLPHKYVDHTHSNAILALSDQKNGDEICEEVFGTELGYVPYIMPGFLLAKEAAKVFRRNPSVRGLILLKHGIFTFSDTAKGAYSGMIKMVTQAEKKLRESKHKSFSQVKLPKSVASVHEIAPIVRGLMFYKKNSVIMDFRTSNEIRTFVGGKNLNRYGNQGTVTPDHVIRTKHKPLILPAPKSDDLASFSRESKRALENYVKKYHAYFARNNKQVKRKKVELDPMPRMVMVPGVGVFGLGDSAKSASIAADLLETNISVITQAEAMGTYAVISEKDIFDIEYWSLEQAKLGKIQQKSLSRKIVVVTGGGSGIGAATAIAFRREGAEICVLDINERAAKSVASNIGGIGIGCDVTKNQDVDRSFREIVSMRGGVDIVISNAGAAWQGKIGEVNERTLRQSFELNFWGHQVVAQNAVKIMKAQGTGGCLLFNTSKQAINPGKNFGPYGLPKAATLFLMKQYALDYASEGIRSNAVNADRIRSGLLTKKMIKSRSKARGLSEEQYMSGNLLKREVTADDVANAFVNLSKSEATTAATITVDGGNIEASLR